MDGIACWQFVIEILEVLKLLGDVLNNYICRYFMYDGLKHSCVEGNHIVNIFSFSKAYGMMGWRVGYVSSAYGFLCLFIMIEKKANSFH